MINETAVWLILLLPLASFAVNALAVRPLLGKDSEVAAYSTIASLAIGFGLSLWALASVIDAADRLAFEPRPWLEVGGLEINFGILMDPLTAVMLVVVTGVSLMVQVYSTGYMKGDPGYVRYFAYMSLFSASMVGLVLASNIVQLYVFWELVGLCSYLLIGFWYERPAAAAAAKKAFIMTRLGDFGFLLAILYLVSNGDSFTDAGFNPLEITDVYKAVAMGGVLTTAAASWIAIGVFAGAVGKSAQFPLHTWLPDAMEGPTPVSALIHAATMVAAGVFLVARFFPVFEVSNVAMDTVALIGGGTALFAASMGLVANDIKRVLAYSTVSQLGFMMLALGVGAYGPAIFHLFTHAFFKALLFLGAGSVNHASGTFDMRHMGGLRKHMPWTFATFLIAGLSLAGIFPLAGLLEQGRAPGARIRRRHGGADRLLAWNRRRVHDGLLHLPRHLHDVHGRVPRRRRRRGGPGAGRGGTSGRVARNDGVAPGGPRRTGSPGRFRQPDVQPGRRSGPLALRLSEPRPGTRRGREVRHGPWRGSRRVWPWPACWWHT